MASGSNLRKTVKEYKSVEHSSSLSSGTKSSIGNVTNTLYRSNVLLRAYSSNHQVLGETSLRSSDGFGWVQTDQDIGYYVFIIPKASLPQSGKYSISVDFGSDFTQDISSVRYRWTKTISSASTASGFITPTGMRFNNAGEFYDSGTVLDLSSNYTELRVHVNLSGSGYRNVGGYFKGNLSLVTDAAVSGEVVGTEYSTADNTSQMVQQNEQILEEQQETNGLLEQIIQHISDQLYALWNQLYNIMALPWKQEQHQDSIDTQDAIEDIGSDITGGISSQTQSINNKLDQHGNFVVNGIKALILPSQADFENYVDRLRQFFQAHFGILEYPFEIALNMIVLIQDTEAQGTIYFPGITLTNFPVFENGSITRYTWTIAQPQTIRMVDNEVFNTLLSYIHLAINMLLTGLLLNQLRRKYEEILNK